MQHTQTILLISAILISWITILFHIPILIPLIVWVGLIIFIFFKKYKYKWLTILLSSFFILPITNFTRGIINYINGNASLETVGEPSFDFFNLNEKYRLWNTTKGCVIYGNESLTYEFNNFAVILCTKLFGFQKNVYANNYPDYKTLEDLIFTKKAELVSGKLCQDNHKYLLTNGSKKIIIPENLYFDFSFENKKCERTESLYLYDNSLLVIIIDSQTIILYDLKNEKVFARYFRE